MITPTDISRLGKFTAYKEVLPDYNSAKAKIQEYNPVLGEAVAVEFMENYEEHTLLGIGGLNGHIEYFSNIIGTQEIDETTVCVDSSTGERMTIADAIQRLWAFKINWEYV